MTTAAAPYRLISLARRKNSCSPSLSEMEFTMLLPCVHLRPASNTSHFEESIITGTRAISGSEAAMFRNVVMAFTPSIMPSSMHTSMICAPASTCPRAMSTASV